ncbi:MAG TPA: hypothetical protein VHZ51_03860 [Ktedonobacteraceae bacterium]|nr:hypothetical protein [Ktedonobacteraceae bacterium]
MPQVPDPTEIKVMAVLQTMGVSQKDIGTCMQQLKSSNPVVIIRADTREQEAESILRKNGSKCYAPAH